MSKARRDKKARKKREHAMIASMRHSTLIDGTLMRRLLREAFDFHNRTWGFMCSDGVRRRR